MSNSYSVHYAVLIRCVTQTCFNCLAAAAWRYDDSDVDVDDRVSSSDFVTTRPRAAHTRLDWFGSVRADTRSSDLKSRRTVTITALRVPFRSF